MSNLELEVAVTNAPFVWTRNDKLSLQGVPMYEREAVKAISARMITSQTSRLDIRWAIQNIRDIDAEALPKVTESYKRAVGLAQQVMGNSVLALARENYGKRRQFENFAIEGTLALVRHCQRHGMDGAPFISRAVDEIVFSR